MAGFMTTSTAMRIFKAASVSDPATKLEMLAFGDTSPVPREDGRRVGWVGMGNPLDVDFSLGVDHGQYTAFSLRVDSRKPSGAAIRLRLAEALRDEAAASQDGKVSAKRKKELKEIITADVTSRAEWLPTLVDCFWDMDAERLLLSTTSEAQIELTLALFSETFGISPEPIAPAGDVSAFFARVFTDGGHELEVDGMPARIEPDGYAVTLAGSEQDEMRAAVSVKNDRETVEKALENGLAIQKMALCLHVHDASESEPTASWPFTLDTALGISGLKPPKRDKDATLEADVLLKAEACFRVARAVEVLASF